MWNPRTLQKIIMSIIFLLWHPSRNCIPYVFHSENHRRGNGGNTEFDKDD